METKVEYSCTTFAEKPIVTNCGLGCNTCGNNTNHFFENKVGLVVRLTRIDELPARLSDDEIITALKEIPARFVHLHRQYFTSRIIDLLLDSMNSTTILCAIGNGFIPAEYEFNVVRRVPWMFKYCSDRTSELLKAAVMSESQSQSYHVQQDLLCENKELLSQAHAEEIIQKYPEMLRFIDMKKYTAKMLETGIAYNGYRYADCYLPWVEYKKQKMLDVLASSNRNYLDAIPKSERTKERCIKMLSQTSINILHIPARLLVDHWVDFVVLPGVLENLVKICKRESPFADENDIYNNVTIIARLYENGLLVATDMPQICARVRHEELEFLQELLNDIDAAAAQETVLVDLV